MYAGNPLTLNQGGAKAALGVLSPPSQAGVPVPVMVPKPLQPQASATTPSWEVLQAVLGTMEVDLEKQLLQAT